MMKYVLVSGGVISGLGKGVIASSTGLLLKTLGLRVTAIKIDPYMNIDAGTMSPLEHGEVFVLDDGGEVDLDLGNYERYLSVTLTKENNITTGKIYSQVIERERKGDYLGKTVQVVPHITNAIQDHIERVAQIPVDDSNETPDVCIIELGGTVGDIESAPFVEAMRQFQFRVGHENFALIHVSLVPVASGEQKSKPTQTAIRDLRGLGLAPDLIACRCRQRLDDALIDKLTMFCHVGPGQVIGVHDVSSTYHVPLLLRQQKIIEYLSKRLGLDEITVSPRQKSQGEARWERWKNLTVSHDRLFDSVSITLVGKYTNLQDSYISVIKSLEHASLRCNRKLDLHWVDSSDLETETLNTSPVKYHTAWKTLCSADGILVPGGFGTRGTEGMIAAAKWAREQKIPYLGICLGLQTAAIEFARNVVGIQAAHSTEFLENAKEPVVIFMPEGSRTHLGGTMRLGLRPTLFQKSTEWSVVRKLYGGGTEIFERHRHRYEINPEYIQRLEANGLQFVGRDDKGERMEIFELPAKSETGPSHPYYVGVQYHPELKRCQSLLYIINGSRPLDPSPPFLGFVAASAGVLDEVLKGINGVSEVNGVNGFVNGVNGN